MINELRAKKYCYEDISLIENYDQAVADKTQTWDCHHRWLTDRNLSTKELKFCSEYYYVPADRLIFLTKFEHGQLHGKNRSETTKAKMIEAWIGKHHSEETKQKISDAHKGKTHSAEAKQKMSEAHKGKHWWNNGVINKLSKDCPGPEWKRGRLPYSQIK